jgi:hypothetical protein
VDIETIIAPQIWTEEHVPPPLVSFDDAGCERKHNGEEYRYLDHHCPVSNADQLFNPRKTVVNSILTTSSKSKPNALSSLDRARPFWKIAQNRGLGDTVCG